MTTKKYQSEPLNLYRIKYNIGSDHAVMNSYHYYQALTAQQALSFHDFSMNKKSYSCQTLSIEKKNIYSNKWEDESDILNQEA